MLGYNDLTLILLETVAANLDRYAAEVNTPPQSSCDDLHGGPNEDGNDCHIFTCARRLAVLSGREMIAH